MKNLKIKFGLFSLLAVLAISAFLTSCDQSELITLTEENVTIDNAKIFQLPHLYDELNDQEIENYVNGLLPEDLAVLEENYRVKFYLTEINKVQTAEKLLQKGDLFSNIDLTSILTQIEINGLEKFEVKPVTESAETDIDYRSPPCYTIGGIIYKARCKRRSCGNGWSHTYWNRQKCHGGYSVYYGPYCTNNCD